MPARQRAVQAFQRLTACLLLCAASLAVPGAAAARNGDLETAVKATFLYKFAPFIGWPPQAFGGQGDPLLICVQGDEAFAGVLAHAADGQRVATHPVQVRAISKVDPGSACRVLYVLGSKAQSAADAIKAARGSPILTVTDTRSGAARGVIHFVLKDSRVRFEIDDQAAAENGLTISSKLLSLAVSVRMRR